MSKLRDFEDLLLPSISSCSCSWYFLGSFNKCFYYRNFFLVVFVRLRRVLNFSVAAFLSFRQRVSSPTTSSPTYEVDSPTSECQFANAYMPVTSEANVQNTFSFASAEVVRRVNERTRNKLYGVKCWVHIFSGLFGSAVDKGTRSN